MRVIIAIPYLHGYNVMITNYKRRTTEILPMHNTDDSRNLHNRNTTP